MTSKSRWDALKSDNDSKNRFKRPNNIKTTFKTDVVKNSRWNRDDFNSKSSNRFNTEPRQSDDRSRESQYNRNKFNKPPQQTNSRWRNDDFQDNRNKFKQRSGGFRKNNRNRKFDNRPSRFSKGEFPDLPGATMRGFDIMKNLTEKPVKKKKEKKKKKKDDSFLYENVETKATQQNDDWNKQMILRMQYETDSEEEEDYSDIPSPRPASDCRWDPEDE